MQRPKWLSDWGEGKNVLQACLLIDSSDIEVVEASFDKKLLLFAVGILRKDEATVPPTRDYRIDEDKSGDLRWKIFYDSTVLPRSISLEKVKALMAGIVSVSAGSNSVYCLDTVFVASGNRPSRGNFPILVDYEIAKKIEDIKKKKTELIDHAPSKEQG